jgi:hypothetical protein
VKGQIKLHSPQRLSLGGGRGERGQTASGCWNRSVRYSSRLGKDWVLTEPITPSTCNENEGFDGLVFAQVAFGINSYKVLYWE